MPESMISEARASFYIMLSGIFLLVARTSRIKFNAHSL